MNKENNLRLLQKFDQGLVEGIEIDKICFVNKKFCPSEEGLVEVKREYSYIYDSSEINFISAFLDDMTQKAKKSELTSSNLLDIITDQIVEKFYTIELEEAEDVYISAKEYADLYYPCIIYIVKNSIRDQVNDLYPNFMAYMNLTEEEGKKPQYNKKSVKYYQYVRYVKRTVNKVFTDLLEVFFLREGNL